MNYQLRIKVNGETKYLSGMSFDRRVAWQLAQGLAVALDCEVEIHYYCAPHDAVPVVVLDAREELCPLEG